MTQEARLGFMQGIGPCRVVADVWGVLAMFYELRIATKYIVGKSGT